MTAMRTRRPVSGERGRRVYGAGPTPARAWGKAAADEPVDALSLYVHIPYCAHRCAFCDLSAGRPRGPEEPLAYLTALRREIVRAIEEERDVQGRPAVSAYFGGGTPTSVQPEGLAGVLWLLRDQFQLSEAAETTVEADPGTVSEETLWALNQAGFNRVSFGVQSLDDRVLRRLGRIHDAARAREAVRWARAQGFRHVSVDLILGLPQVSPALWRATVREVAAWEVDHVSVYALQVEEGTAFGRRQRAGHLGLPPDDLVVEMGDEGEAILAAAGFERYELASYARAGGRSLHNEGYWTGRAYRGFGAGAHSYLDGERRWNERSPRRYIAAVVGGQSPVAGRERLDPAAARAEAAALALRRDRGIERAAFAHAFGVDPVEWFASAWERLTDADLVAVDGERVVLTARGRWLYNQVATALLP
jgi:oxygen-independent coproporphyrinogen-3 oxidase